MVKKLLFEIQNDEDVQQQTADDFLSMKSNNMSKSRQRGYTLAYLWQKKSLCNIDGCVGAQINTHGRHIATTHKRMKQNDIPVEVSTQSEEATYSASTKQACQSLKNGH
jgi:hypothetical protein